MPVNVGIIGTNWGAKTQVPIFRAAGLEVVALYSRRLEKAQGICEKADIAHAFDSVEDLCNCPDVDVVSMLDADTEMNIHRSRDTRPR